MKSLESGPKIGPGTSVSPKVLKFLMDDTDMHRFKNPPG